MLAEKREPPFGGSMVLLARRLLHALLHHGNRINLCEPLRYGEELGVDAVS